MRIQGRWGLSMTDVDLLRQIARARALMETLSTAEGRLDRLLALEAELDRRVQLRRDRARGAWAGFAATV